jgi:myo-inositol-1(or 4)-monophosphatase
MTTAPELLELAVEAAIRAARLLREEYLTDAGISSAEGKDIKTQADLAAQDCIHSALECSGIEILAEEGEHDQEVLHNRFWVVDPLDGTLNFTRGFPMAAVSIGLWDGFGPILGVIVDVFTGDVFSGEVGRGAWLNGQPILVSQVQDPGQAVIATGFPSGRSYDEAALLKFVAKVRQFKKVRMLGSAAMMLAQVAAGRFDAYEEEDIYLWDVVAGLAIIKAAGGDSLMLPGSGPSQYHVLASNGVLQADGFPSNVAL